MGMTRLCTRRVLAGLGLAVLASCARGHVEQVGASAGPALPPPARVVVYDFGVSPEAVRLNQGMGARLQRGMESEEDVSEQKLRIATATQAALAAGLVRGLAGYGLPVEQAGMGAPGGAGADASPALLVRGRILSVDEGNRARRVVIGFGAGASRITAEAELYYVPATGGAPVSLAMFTAESDSGRMPGMAVPVGAGAAAGRAASSAVVGGTLHGASEMRATGDEQNAQRLAAPLAKKIGSFAASQGWIPASAVR
jgi:hypothetical protein